MAGIVDCASACHGPTAVDMAHTRCNLMIDGSEAAERFLLEYQKGEFCRHAEAAAWPACGWHPSRAAPHLLPSLVRGGNGDQSHPRTSRASYVDSHESQDGRSHTSKTNRRRPKVARCGTGTPSKLNRRIEITRR